MKSYIFLDEKTKSYGKVLDDKLIEMFFYNEDLGNIYRAKVVNKIDPINAYFLEYEEGKQAFLKSKKNFSIGDSVIGQIVRPASNKKLPLFSANFNIETENYELFRFPKKSKPSLKNHGDKDKKEYESLIDLKERLEREENFNPTPKTLLKKNTKDLYIERNKDLQIKKVSIFQDQIINQGLKLLKEDKIYHKDVSLIIDELETLTVIDVNSSSKKGGQEKEIFFDQINKSILDFLAYNLKLRNIGGMVVIDFLRGYDKEGLEKEFENALDSYGLSYELFGFTNMGLFELTIKRRGESLKTLLHKNKII